MKKREASWYREPLVWLVILIPASSVVMGIAAWIIAARSFDGLVVDDYYRQGLEINRSLERDKAAARYGLGSTLRLDDAHAAVHATFTANPGFHLPALVHLGLFHGTRAGFDQAVTLRRTATGEYAGTLPALVPGHWYLELRADDWRLTGSFTEPGTAQVILGSPQPFS